TARSPSSSRPDGSPAGVERAHQVFDGRFDDGDVAQLDPRGDRGDQGGRGRVAGGEREALAQAVGLDAHVVHAGQASQRVGGRGQLDDDLAGAAGAGAQRVDRVVGDDPAVVDHDDAAAEPFDVGEVVGGEQDRHAVDDVDLLQERAQPLLAHQVEP